MRSRRHPYLDNLAASIKEVWPRFWKPELPPLRQEDFYGDPALLVGYAERAHPDELPYLVAYRPLAKDGQSRQGWSITQVQLTAVEPPRPLDTGLGDRQVLSRLLQHWVALQMGQYYLAQLSPSLRISSPHSDPLRWREVSVAGVASS